MTTDPPKETSKLSYDKEKRQVTGDGYRIRQVGQQTGESLNGIFLYRDDRIEFYFLAERTVWVQLGKHSHDTGYYVVNRLWCTDQGCVYVYKDIPKEVKEKAKSNILEGMWLMEGFEKKPPIGVGLSDAYFINPDL